MNRHTVHKKILMPQDTKKRHKAGAYGDFLEKCGAKLAVNTPFGVVNTGSKHYQPHNYKQCEQRGDILWRR